MHVQVTVNGLYTFKNLFPKKGKLCKLMTSNKNLQSFYFHLSDLNMSLTGDSIHIGMLI
jgi:hypothetical protein